MSGNRDRRGLGVAMLLLAACRGGDPPAQARPVRESAPVDARDQYRLASMIDDAKQGPATGLEKVRQDWLGSRLRWEVGFLAPLCRDEGPCVALPFDRARYQPRLPQGWLPRLELDADQRRELARRCSEVAGQCVFAFEGTLDRFELGPDRPTSLTFSAVELGAARPAGASESWARRPPRSKSTARVEPRPGGSRTGSGRG